MAKKPKLSDMQLVLLSTASQREGGNFFPIADSLKGGESRINKAIQGLIKHGYAVEGQVGSTVPNWREDGDRRLGVIITTEGKVAIHAGEGGAGDKGQEPPATPPRAAPASPECKPGEIRAGTKQALLVEMLEREEGASIQQIVDATGWLPHTTRAALTGLKKRGYEITSEKVEGVGCYHAKKAVSR